MTGVTAMFLGAGGFVGETFSLTVGVNPGGQGATYLGYSFSPTVGAISPNIFKGYLISIISESAQGALQIGLDNIAPEGTIKGIRYKGRTLLNPLYFSDQGVGYFYWNNQGSRLLVNGENTPFIIG